MKGIEIVEDTVVNMLKQGIIVKVFPTNVDIVNRCIDRGIPKETAKGQVRGILKIINLHLLGKNIDEIFKIVKKSRGLSCVKRTIDKWKK